MAGDKAKQTMFHVWRCEPDGTPMFCGKCGVTMENKKFDVCLAGIVKPTPLIGNVCNC